MDKKELRGLVIDIFENSDGDWNYSIYEAVEDIENGEDELDGGCCTGSLEDALEMAYDQAGALL